MKKNLPIFPLIKDYFIMTIGCVVAAFGIECFLVPNNLAAGGISGTATVLHNLIPMSVGTISLILNIPIFILGVIFEGNKFGIKTLYSTVMLSVFLNVFTLIKPITDDYILASLYGGVISGIGLGTVFLVGATTGGTDILAKIFAKKFQSLSIGRLILIMDFFVITFAVIVFRNLYVGLYSVIALFASSYMVDTLLEGVDFAKTVFIITVKEKEISRVILKYLNRGVTGLYGQGMYTGNEKTVLLCTMKKNQIPKLKSLVTGIDPNAFVITTDVREVIGDGFKRI